MWVRVKMLVTEDVLTVAIIVVNLNAQITVLTIVPQVVVLDVKTDVPVGALDVHLVLEHARQKLLTEGALDVEEKVDVHRHVNTIAITIVYRGDVNLFVV